MQNKYELNPNEDVISRVSWDYFIKCTVPQFCQGIKSWQLNLKNKQKFLPEYNDITCDLFIIVNFITLSCFNSGILFKTESCQAFLPEQQRKCCKIYRFKSNEFLWDELRQEILEDTYKYYAQAHDFTEDFKKEIMKEKLNAIKYEFEV